jgi:hypothetical protein
MRAGLSLEKTLASIRIDRVCSHATCPITTQFARYWSNYCSVCTPLIKLLFSLHATGPVVLLYLLYSHRIVRTPIKQPLFECICIVRVCSHASGPITLQFARHCPDLPYRAPCGHETRKEYSQRTSRKSPDNSSCAPSSDRQTSIFHLLHQTRLRFYR